MSDERPTLDGSTPSTRSSYGRGEKHDAARLFTPAPEELPGQSDLFDPDDQERDVE